MQTHIVDVKGKSDREEFINELKKKGYKVVDYNENDIFSNFLPIVVDTKNKTINMVGNITCAAAAASCKRIEDLETFWNEFNNK